MTPLTITIPRRKVALVLGMVALFLCLLSISLKALEWELGTDSTYWIYQTVRVFNVNREANIPAYFSALLLLSAALMLLLITRIKKQQQGRYIWAWGLLAFLFLYLSIDEAAELHEKFTIYFQERYPESVQGPLYFGWVLVGIPFAGIMGLLFLKFWWHLPPRTRLHFLIAGALYVGGALGIELVSANQWYLNEGASLKYSAIGTVEELCEMEGIVVLIYGLLTHLESLIANIDIRINE